MVKTEIIKKLNYLNMKAYRSHNKGKLSFQSYTYINWLLAQEMRGLVKRR